VSQGDIAGIEDQVIAEINQRLKPDYARFSEEPLALISVVGEGMRHQIGMAETVTRSLADHGINIETIDQGSSEISMIFGVKEADYKKAIKGLYKDLLRRE
jgi:aspartate kinase